MKIRNLNDGEVDIYCDVSKRVSWPTMNSSGSRGRGRFYEYVLCYTCFDIVDHAPTWLLTVPRCFPRYDVAAHVTAYNTRYDIATQYLSHGTLSHLRIFYIFIILHIDSQKAYHIQFIINYDNKFVYSYFAT